MRIVIAAEEHLAARPDRIAPGDTLAITATVQVYDSRHDLTDVTSVGGPPEHLPGELQLETVALKPLIEAAQ